MLWCIYHSISEDATHAVLCPCHGYGASKPTTYKVRDVEHVMLQSNHRNDSYNQ